MKIGIDLYTISHLGLTTLDALDFARARGFDGVQVLEPSAIAPDLAPERLLEIRRRADELGLYLEMGLPSPNPSGLLGPPGSPTSPADRASWLRPHLEAVAALGLNHARAYVAGRHDRFRTDVPWTEQLQATLQVLRLLRGDLMSLGLRIAIETHADMTCEEILWLIDAVGDDVLGVTLDSGNLPMRLDDPIRSATALAPLVLMTHIKDAALEFSDRGLRWQARPIGEGCIPIAEIVELLHAQAPVLNASIELHPRTYDLPIFDPGWLAAFPSLRPESLASVVRLSALCEARYDEGSMPRPAEVEAIPWEARCDSWIDQSRRFLRSLLGQADDGQPAV